jgi:hypothetical protein
VRGEGRDWRGVYGEAAGEHFGRCWHFCLRYWGWVCGGCDVWVVEAQKGVRGLRRGVDEVITDCRKGREG